jgi:hypothetical protein
VEAQVQVWVWVQAWVQLGVSGMVQLEGRLMANFQAAPGYFAYESEDTVKSLAYI